jgi:hypothetical protein
MGSHRSKQKNNTRRECKEQEFNLYQNNAVFAMYACGADKIKGKSSFMEKPE